MTLQSALAGLTLQPHYNWNIADIPLLLDLLIIAGVMPVGFKLQEAKSPGSMDWIAKWQARANWSLVFCGVLNW